MFQKILVPLDGSELSEGAIEPALEVAGRFGGTVTLFRAAVLPEHLMVSPVPIAPATYTEIQNTITEGVKTYLTEVQERLQGRAEVVTAQSHGDAANEILDYAEKNAVDLIVMSTHGRSGFQRWLFGSVAEKVMRHAPCPVLSVRPARHG